MRVVHRLPFTSDLRRMSVVVKPSSPGGQDRGLLLLTKGAPETVRALLQEVPPAYDSTYLHHMSCGHRVIAMATKGYPSSTSEGELRKQPRHELEAGLTFVGFAVLDCPLKRDSRSVVEKLQR